MARHKLLTEQEASEYLRIPLATLINQRFRPPRSRPALPFVKMPNGKIMYREDQLNAYIETVTETPAPQPERQARRKAG